MLESWRVRKMRCMLRSVMKESSFNIRIYKKIGYSLSVVRFEWNLVLSTVRNSID